MYIDSFTLGVPWQSQKDAVAYDELDVRKGQDSKRSPNKTED